MRSVTPIAVFIGFVSVVVLGAQAPAARGSLDAAMQAFWNASSAGDRDDAGRKIASSGAACGEVHQRLQAGRPYAKQKTGRIELPTRDHGASLDNVVDVPADYDPAHAWPLRVSLHGGVGRHPPAPGEPPARP